MHMPIIVLGLILLDIHHISGDPTAATITLFLLLYAALIDIMMLIRQGRLWRWRLLLHRRSSSCWSYCNWIVFYFENIWDFPWFLIFIRGDRQRARFNNVRLYLWALVITCIESSESLRSRVKSNAFLRSLLKLLLWWELF